jgi:DNA-binding response OmpR family regulator
MRVLLVEDDSSTAKSIELMLKSEGYIVDTTDLGEDGLEIGKTLRLRHHHSRPDAAGHGRI